MARQDKSNKSRPAGLYLSPFFPVFEDVPFAGGLLTCSKYINSTAAVFFKRWMNDLIESSIQIKLIDL